MKNKMLSVLLAEDNPISSKLAQINLTKLGHSIDVVYNGADAVMKFRHGHYDVILMDIEMPLMNGLDASKKIREIENGMKDCDKVKIVAMTAHDPDDLRSLEDAGIDTFCCKPYRKEDLSNILDSI